jgi:signal transduction histidine kinase
LHITIADSGVGIGEDEVKFLCEPYAQLEKGKKNFARALKLGTATILIKRSEGLFDISSEVMNGAKYDVILPILKDRDEQGNT